MGNISTLFGNHLPVMELWITCIQKAAVLTLPHWEATGIIGAGQNSSIFINGKYFQTDLRPAF